MDRAGVAIVRGTCVGIEGAALEACGTPVIAETGKAFTIREGQAPQLAQDLISIMGVLLMSNGSVGSRAPPGRFLRR